MILTLLVLLAAVATRSARSADEHFICPGKDIAFKASDGTKLVAHRYGKGKTFVVLAHQYGADLCQWQPYVKWLTSPGYSVLAFDFRGYGQSQVRAGAAAQRLDLDVAAAAKLARKLGARKVFLLGASNGGWAALVSGPSITPALAGVVTLSAPPQPFASGADATTTVASLRVPVLYVASQGEGLAEATQRMYEATASQDRKIRIVSGTAHGVELIDPVLGKPGWRQTRAVIAAFIRTH